MFPIGGQTTGSNGLKVYDKKSIFFHNFFLPFFFLRATPRALQLVFHNIHMIARNEIQNAQTRLNHKLLNKIHKLFKN